MFKTFNFVIKDGRIQLSNIQTNESLVTVTEFALFPTNKSLQCMSHRIFPCISNKDVFSVTITELHFQFYN